MSADVMTAEPVAFDREPGVSTAPGGPEAGRIATGQCWRGLYEIGERLPEAAGLGYRARHVETGREVQLRSRARDGSSDRAALREKLQAIDCAQLPRLLEVHVNEVEDVEVWSAVPGTSLREWRGHQPEPGIGIVTALVRQVAGALDALHRQGLGHFALTPDRIFVQESAEGPQFFVGGLDRSAEIEAGELIPIEVDALSAPPEAVGLFKHSPGLRLLAWDWWSLGRVVQEFLVGRHAILLLPEDLAARLPRGLLGLAEALLFERATGSLRAGAVELMGKLDPRVDRLLRGLLTSAVEGRWGGEEVRAWLAGELPSERYAAHRNERFFQIKGRAYAIAEAAERLQGPEHSAQIDDHAWAADQPGTLAHFLAGSAAHRDQLEQLQAATGLSNSTALTKVAPALRRSIGSALALHALAAGPFRWRGQILNADSVRAGLVHAEKSAVFRAELLALAEPVVIMQIRRHDPNAAGLLESFVKLAVEAESVFIRQLGINRATLGDVSRVWLRALAGEAAWLTAHQNLKTRYARTTLAAVEKLYAAAHPTPVILLVFARMEEEPERFGFITHEEVRRRRLADLHQRHTALLGVVFWCRLAAAMRAGPVIFGRRWLVAAAAVGAITLLAIHVPGPAGMLVGLGPLLVAVGLRFAANRHQAGLVARWAVDVKPWSWRDGLGRCETELTTLAAKMGQPASSAAATAALADLREEMRTITVAGDPVPRELAPRHLGTWVAGAVGWVLAATLIIGSAWQAVRRPPAWSAHGAAWKHALTSERALAEEARIHSLLVWPYRASLVDEPYEVTVQGKFDPTPEQLRGALEQGRAQVARYKPETITAQTAVYISIDAQHGALMLFDGKKGVLSGNKGVLVNVVPLARSWIQIGDQRALFIGR